MITKTYTITATPDTLLKFERFMAFLHFNGGHSGTFCMTFDGDGHERFKVEPEPPKNGDHWKINTGQTFEVARDKDYASFPCDHTKHYYTAKNGILEKHIRE